MDTLEKIKDLEIELHQEETRKNAYRLKQLLSYEFIEFGTSGKVHTYEDEISNLPQETFHKIEAFDFNMRKLSQEVIQVTYKTKRTLENGESHALRSSLWIQENETWKMIFHQSTKL